MRKKGERSRKSSKKRGASLGPRNRARLWRLLDANGNRAREGLRVVEDAVRFYWERDTQKIRQTRHAIDALMRSHYGTLLRHRGVRTDPGRENSSRTYPTIDVLLAANFKRVTEALRALEEYGRLISRGFSAKAQRLRFIVYQLERSLVLRVGHKGKKP